MTDGSNVYMAALDAKKAFHRVHHLKLFHVLFDRKMSFFIIKIIVNWYSKMFASVRWNGAFSNMSPIKSGMLQSSILSSSLFNLYVYVIIVALSKVGYGCFVRQIYMGCIVYADDIILLLASLRSKKCWIFVFIKGKNLILFLTTQNHFC